MGKTNVKVEPSESLGLQVLLRATVFAIFFLALVSSVRAWSATSAPVSTEQVEAYFKAAKAGEKEKLQKSLEAGMPIDIQNDDGYTALIYATYYGHRDAARYLLSATDKHGKKANPCLGDKKGNTALFGALFKGFDDLATELLPLCETDIMNNQGQTPLMYASLFGRADMAKKLLEKGADPLKKDFAGYDAVSLAEGQWNQIMVKVLKATRIIR